MADRAAPRHTGPVPESAEVTRQRFLACQGEPCLWWWRGRWVRHLPLPWRVRLRLRARHQVDRAAIWLATRGHENAARLLWRACGRW